MNDGPALLRSILERPDDDLPRLVYADHLSDIGEHERAELIRVQCEMERLDPYHRSCTGNKCPGCSHLRRREQELFRLAPEGVIGKSADWFPGGLNGFVLMLRDPRSFSEEDAPSANVRRGFVDEIVVSSEMLTEDFVRDVWSHHPVRRVEVSDAVVWQSGGNNTYYIGGLDRYPRKYWRRLVGLPSVRAARGALSDVIVAWGRELAGLPPLKM